MQLNWRLFESWDLILRLGLAHSSLIWSPNPPPGSFYRLIWQICWREALLRKLLPLKGGSANQTNRLAQLKKKNSTSDAWPEGFQSQLKTSQSNWRQNILTEDTISNLTLGLFYHLYFIVKNPKTGLELQNTFFKLGVNFICSSDSIIRKWKIIYVHVLSTNPDKCPRSPENLI